MNEVKPNDLDDPRPRCRRRSGLWLLAFVLLALGQVFWGGYQWGAGNQSIQVPFLKKAIDPGLYPRDVMIRETLPAYPTWFFRILAWVTPVHAVPDVYLVLHLLTAVAVLLAVFSLARAYADDDWTGLVAVLVVLGGQHQSLTGEPLYLPVFSHTWASFPVALAVLVLFLRDRQLAAWALAGALFNLHALTAAYLGVMLTGGTLASWRERSWRQWLVLPAVYLLAAAPTLVPLLLQFATFDAGWIRLTRIRSAVHAFPSSNWQRGNADLPRFLLMAGTAALAFGFPVPARTRRWTVGLIAGVAVLLLVGWLGAEVWPVPVILRAQLFRGSHLLLVVLLVTIAQGLVAGWRTPFGDQAGRVRWRRWLEFASAAGLGLCLVVPACLPLLPLAFIGALATAIVNGRLSRWQALVAGLVLVGCLAAHRAIAFPWWGWAAGTTLAGRLALAAFAAGMLAWLADRWLRSRWPRWLAAMAALTAAGVLAGTLWWQETVRRAAPDSWTDVQNWVRDHTPRAAVVLTPIQPGGFRIGSERSVVGEWRDGTQLFFAPGFGDTWWSRMTTLQPGLMADQAGGRLLAPGRSLASLDDDRILGLCRRFGATHVVLPAARTGTLVRLYRNLDWAVYQPVVRPEPVLTAADDASQRERFFRDVVLPNIVKYRQGDLTVQVVDETGRPLRGARYAVRQVRHAFHFSGSLPFFVEPRGSAGPDFKPPPVTEAELARFPEVFNFSLIPYSGKWLYLEPEEGRQEYADLDRYVAWCREHGIGMELHFVSGYPPAWLAKKPAAEQGERFLGHARELATRYGEAIEYWQVVNEQQLIQQSPPVFREFRRLAPRAKLGISDCANFYSGEKPPNRLRNLCRGLDEIRWLKKQGVTLDFFGVHGHRPFGAWPDPREMYQVLDAFAREGVKVHITEFALPLGVDILGSDRHGKWTPELQAEFYAWFFTVCFSHPAVELINLWGMGPVNWQPGTGLLDAKYQPKPAFEALRKLFNERWHTERTGVLELDGTASIRGFYGDYELSVTLEDGKAVRATFALEPGAKGRYRFRLDRDTGTLTQE